MAKKHDQQYYLKKCKQTLWEIMNLGKDQGEVFLKLKKKAAKYLEKAKEFEKEKTGQ